MRDSQSTNYQGGAKWVAFLSSLLILDDECLGCGGTIAKLVAAGEEVHALFVCDGVTSRLPVRFGVGAEPYLEIFEREGMAWVVAKVLGIESLRFLRLADNALDARPLLPLVQEIEKSLNDLHPTTVYTNSGSDLNVDHRLTFQAVLTATRPVPGQSVLDVYSFEVLSSTEWNFPARFSPNVFVDVTSFMSAKERALSAYNQEIRLMPHPRSLAAVRALATLRGSTAGFYAAEAFELVRSIRR